MKYAKMVRNNAPAARDRTFLLFTVDRDEQRMRHVDDVVPVDGAYRPHETCYAAFDIRLSFDLPARPRPAHAAGAVLRAASADPASLRARVSLRPRPAQPPQPPLSPDVSARTARTRVLSTRQNVSWH
jgi:hypothetical protein